MAKTLPRKRAEGEGGAGRCMALVLGINFKQSKQLVLCSVVPFRRKPRAVHEVTVLSRGGMVRNTTASNGQAVRPVSSGTGNKHSA